jgi:hypothetical protein
MLKNLFIRENLKRKEVKKMKKICYIIAMMVIMLYLATTANADIIENALFYNELNLLSDNSGEYLRNANGSTADGGDSIVAIGDFLRGTFYIGTIEDATGGGGTRNVGAGTSFNEWTGVFELEVLTKSFDGVNYNWTFGPSTAFQTEIETLLGKPAGSLSGTLVAMFQDTTPDYTRLGGLPDDVGSVSEESILAFSMLNAGASYFWSLGFTGTPLGDGSGATTVAGEGWFTSSVTDDIAIIGAIPLPANGGVVNFGLNLLDNNTSVQLGLVPTIFGGSANAGGSGSLLGLSGASTALDNFDNIDIAIQPIPEPATVTLLGSGLIGISIFLRKRMRK